MTTSDNEFPESELAESELPENELNAAFTMGLSTAARKMRNLFDSVCGSAD